MDEPKTTSGMAPARRQQFEADIAKIRLKTGTAGGEQRMVLLGAVLMAGGAALALVAYLTSGSQADTRDILSMLILAALGIAITIAGAAVFLRYSLGRFLRFWLLRLIYEQQPEAHDDPAA